MFSNYGKFYCKLCSRKHQRDWVPITLSVRRLHALLCRYFHKVKYFFWNFHWSSCANAQLSQVWKRVARRWPLQSILRWSCMLKSNRKSNYFQLRDRANHHSKFCFYVSYTTISTLNISVQNVQKDYKFYKGQVLIYNVNCLLEGNVLAQKQS